MKCNLHATEIRVVDRCDGTVQRENRGTSFDETSPELDSIDFGATVQPLKRIRFRSSSIIEIGTSACRCVRGERSFHRLLDIQRSIPQNFSRGQERSAGREFRTFKNLEPCQYLTNNVPACCRCLTGKEKVRIGALQRRDQHPRSVN